MVKTRKIRLCITFLFVASPLGCSRGDFTLPTLDGKKVSLNDFRGNVILLNFWGVG